MLEAQNVSNYHDLELRHAWVLNGFGFYRAPFNTNDSPNITRNPGWINAGFQPLRTPLSDLYTCADEPTEPEWDECLNRLLDGAHLTPHLYMGGFNDEDQSYVMVVVLITFLSCAVAFLCCPCCLPSLCLRRYSRCDKLRGRCGEKRGRAIYDEVSCCCSTAPLVVMGIVLCLTGSMHSDVWYAGNTINSFVAGVAGAGLAPNEWANSKIVCPSAGTCIVGETSPKECGCTYKASSTVNFLTTGQGFGSHSDFYDATSSPNDPIFYPFHNFYMTQYLQAPT